MIYLKNQIATNTFINDCPGLTRGFLHAYKPDSLESGYEMLVETGSVNYDGARKYVDTNANQSDVDRNYVNVQNLIPSGDSRFQNRKKLFLSSDVFMNTVISRLTSFYVNVDFRCLVDTGCATPILNSKLVIKNRLYRLFKPIQICSVNRISSTLNGFYSEFPKK